MSLDDVRKTDASVGGMGDHDGRSADATSVIRDTVRNLPAYDPGAHPVEVATRSGVDRVIKLSNNENPFGISPRAVDAVARHSAESLIRYPDPTGMLLTQAIGDSVGVPPERVVLGNGSENILELVSLAVLDPGDLVVTQSPGFSLHEIFPRMVGARVVKVPVTADFTVDADAWRDALSAGPTLVFLANPCNPTGTILTSAELQRIIADTPRSALLVLDEAYYEFACGNPSYPDGVDLLRESDRPWMVLRTFSKAYGLAALRVGYGIASSASLVTALDRVRAPYNVNQLAQDAALAALGDREHVDTTIRRTAEEIARVTLLLRTSGFRVVDSSCNFLFIDTGNGSDWVAERLHDEGFIVKAWREAGYDTYIRASLSTREDNDIFVECLAKICGVQQ